MAAFLKLIRWPNLFFIILTQFLFYYCIYLPLYGAAHNRQMAWIIAASVLIAAAGYIINDYFDLNIDQINKPQKNVFAGKLNRRWAIIWHLLLNILGVVATVFAVGLHRWYLVLANVGAIVFLWFYSTSYKRKLLIGNILISVLTAWTILIVFFMLTDAGQAVDGTDVHAPKFFRASFLYAGFAFISSLIREAIKDCEDLVGDARYGCRTLPIVAGIRGTNIYISVWIVVLISALVVLQVYVVPYRWWWAIGYSVVFVIAPLVLLLIDQAKASRPEDFARLSGIAKLIMLAGILSMVFFRIYF